MRPDTGRIVLLSLAIEDAMKRDEWAEVNELLDARERAIHEFAATGHAIHPTEFGRILAAEQRMIQLLETSQAAVAQELRGAKVKERVRWAYQTGPDSAICYSTT